MLPSSQAGIIHDGVVVVSGDRITKVGSWDSLKDSHGASTVRNLGDVTLMPGLFDCHVSDQRVSYMQKRAMTKFSYSQASLADGPNQGPDLHCH